MLRNCFLDLAAVALAPSSLTSAFVGRQRRHSPHQHHPLDVPDDRPLLPAVVPSGCKEALMVVVHSIVVFVVVCC